MKEYTNRSVRQKVEPRNRPQCEYNQLIFDKGENTTEQAVFFNKLVLEQLGIFLYWVQKNESRHRSHTLQKINTNKSSP